MKIVVIAQYNPHFFPAHRQLAAVMNDTGAEVQFLSACESPEGDAAAQHISRFRIPVVEGIRAPALISCGRTFHLPFLSQKRARLDRRAE